MFRKIFALIIICILFTNICIFAVDINTYSVPVWSDNANIQCTTNIANDLVLESKSAILMDISTGKVLFERNSNEQLRPASVTKIMTILLIMEQLDNGNIKLEDVVPCSEKAMSMGGSQIWLDPKDKLTVHEMLKSICVVSANDCCVAMAEYICGSEENFVNLMNEKAKQLNMNNTTFKNCHGLDEDGHLTTSNDIALMSKELLSKYPNVTEYTTIWMDTLRDGTSELVNTNKLLRTYNGITGLKTGSTSLALFNVSATATRNDLSLVSVIMSGPTSKVRFNEAAKLLDIGFANYTSKKLCEKGSIYGDILIQKGKENMIDVIYENDVNVLLKKGEDKNIERQEIINNNIKAPIKKDTKVGEVIFNIDGQEVGRVNVITYYDVDKLTFIDNIQKISNYVFTLGRKNK